MTNEKRLALIKHCQLNIAQAKGILTRLGSLDETLDTVRKIRTELSLQQIALASLQAEPVGYIAEVNGNRVGVIRRSPMPKAGEYFYTTPPTPADSDLICAINRLLDSDGSRGTFSAIKCSDARQEIERLLAAAPKPGGDES